MNGSQGLLSQPFSAPAGQAKAVATRLWRPQFVIDVWAVSYRDGATIGLSKILPTK
jgi:hypothetical protein